jgi:ABC-2 type transport system ATP-binding protein
LRRGATATPADRPAVRIAGLRVVRGGHRVLHDFALEIAPGQVTGLIGPSGCGKTTLMRAIVGVQVVAGGSVEVLGAPAGTPALRRRVGYLPQAPSVYRDLTVRENVQYFAGLLGVGGAAVESALDTVGLRAREGQVAASLSGGQLARVSLATVLLGEPDLLVLDEPTVGLDPVLRGELWDTFRALTARGATLLISTHVMDEAERCDRVVLMRDGTTLAHDTPAELLRATGTAEIEDAFLALINGAAAPGGAP